MGESIGIDLGTTRSAVSVLENGEPSLILNSNDKRLTPSAVMFKEGEVLVGEQALRRKKVEPENLVTEIKRHMGDSDYTVGVRGEERDPVEVSACIVERLLEDAREIYDEVDDVVVTVPAYFTADQRQDTKDAVVAAGMDEEDVELLREPTAAALAYGHREDVDETVMAYDFGGGTLDISILEIHDNVFKTVATSGDLQLGGVDFTWSLVDEIATDYEMEEGVDIRDDYETEANLFDACETVKKDLSSHDVSEINSPFLGEIDDELVGIEERVITREYFEEVCEEHLVNSLEPVKDALDKAEMDPGDIDNVLMVGGSSRIPAVQEDLEDFFGFEPQVAKDPDRVVAYGAAIKTGISDDVREVYECPICSEEFEAVTDMLVHVVEESGGGKCPFPDCEAELSSEDELEDHLAAEHSTGIADTKTKRDSKMIQSTVARSLGTSIRFGRMSVILPSGIELPAERTERYTTVHDDQTAFRVDLFQGESSSVEDNEKLNNWRVSGLPEMDKGEPNINITFSMNEEGLLDIETYEEESGLEAETTVDTSGTGSIEGGVERAQD